MCGIAGLISRNRQFDKTHLDQMIEAMAHRGPNGSHFWSNAEGYVHLGHRRLAVIDTSEAAAQPMHYMDRYSIVHNGEIYNYLELKETLQKRGYLFRTASDTEVILASFDCWKEECLQQFDGMFAFAIWDDKEKKIFVARDRLGQKPFYYFFDEHTGNFAFASEIKAFRGLNVLSEINERQLLLFLSNGFTNDPREPVHTFYKSVFQLPPAHFLWVDLTSSEQMIVMKTWWDIDKEHEEMPDDDIAIEKFTSLFQQALKRMFRSDIPVGTCLSGGLDSSSIVAMASQLNQQQNSYKVFSAVFPGFEKDESNYSSDVAKQFNLQQFTTGTMNLAEELGSFLYQQDEPVASAGVYAQYKVFELARSQGIQVLLDGQGADEILAGYTKYLHWFLQEMLVNNRRTFRKEKSALKSNGVPFDWGWMNYAAAVFPAHAAVQLEKRTVRRMKNNGFLHKELIRRITDNSQDEIIFKPFVAKLNDLLYFNTCHGSLQELLRYADRNAMAHGCEVRLPFLNHQLVEFVFSLPSTFKIRDGYTKWILRKSVDKLLPSSITWRKDKVGFEPPQENWMKEKKLKEMIGVAKVDLVNRQILDKAALHKKIQPHGAHAADSFDWRYLVASQWLQNQKT
jgi:asparagine synthase (glutamine-hydrolysing)